MSKVRDVMVMNVASVTSFARITEVAQELRQSGQVCFVCSRRATLTKLMKCSTLEESAAVF